MKSQAFQRHTPALDGIRGLAIVVVMLCHLANTLPSHGLGRFLFPIFVSGWAGVDLFFALSGFLITGILLDTKNATNYLSSFYGRRFLRIFPVYYSALILLNAAAVLSAGHHWLQSLIPGWPDRIAYLAYLQNLPMFWSQTGPGNVVAHFWSLAVEEQFYLLWPLVIRLLSTRALLRVTAAGLAAAIPLRCLLIQTLGLEAALKSSAGRMDGLLVGALIAILVRQGGVPRRLVQFFGSLGVMILIVLTGKGEFAPPGKQMFTFGVTAFALLSGYLITSALRPGIVQAAFETRWLRSFGKYSYGLYIIHFPVFVIAKSLVGNVARANIVYSLVFAVAMFSVSFGLAKLSYDCFESRFLGLKHRFDPRFADMPEEQAPKAARLKLRPFPITRPAISS